MPSSRLKTRRPVSSARMTAEPFSASHIRQSLRETARTSRKSTAFTNSVKRRWHRTLRRGSNHNEDSFTHAPYKPIPPQSHASQPRRDCQPPGLRRHIFNHYHLEHPEGRWYSPHHRRQIARRIDAARLLTRLRSTRTTRHRPTSIQENTRLVAKKNTYCSINKKRLIKR